MQNFGLATTLSTPGGGGGGDSAYERAGDARRKFWMKPLKETDLGASQPFCPENTPNIFSVDRFWLVNY